MPAPRDLATQNARVDRHDAPAWQVLKVLLQFVWIDLVGVFGFKTLHRLVTRTPVAARKASSEEITVVCEAVRDACTLYFKPVLCLQRSAAATQMLRRLGAPATLVIGYRPAPIASHAWVEVNGEIVSDQINGQEFYHVVDRW